MSKTTRVYFGVLQSPPPPPPPPPPYKNFVLEIHTPACACSISDHFFSCLLQTLERDSHLSHQSSVRTTSPVLIFPSRICTYSFESIYRTGHPHQANTLLCRYILNLRLIQKRLNLGSDTTCHALNPGPTRLADPNRFLGRETQDWDSLPDFFFFFLKQNLYLWVWPTSDNLSKYFIYKSKNYHRSGVRQNLDIYN